MLETSTIYLRLRGEHGDSFGRKLGLHLLPVLSPIPTLLDGGEYGPLSVFYIDASRLSGSETRRLIDWIWRGGDNPDRDAVRENVLSNRATYRVVEGDQSEVIIHDPTAWG